VNAIDVGIVSVVPSPYQQDIFHALANCEGLFVSVYYLEHESPDSPWPRSALRSFERVLPGFWLSIGGARFHIVTHWPKLDRHDVIILNSLTSSLSQTYLRKRRSTQKLILWAEPLRTQSTSLRRATQRLLTSPIEKSDAIVAIGSWARSCYQRQFPNIPTFNIPYHCELESFLRRSAKPSSKTSETIFLFCGQMIPRKGVDVLIRAFDALVMAGAPAQLLLVGRRADLDEMLRPASAAAKERICYEGFIPPDRLPELFARADVFVLPSRHDGWGVVVNQAMAAGLPIICTEAVGAGFDLVRDGVNGFRIPVNDPEKLMEVMKFFLEDKQRQFEFGAASRSFAAQWTPEQGAEKWRTVLSKVMAQDANPASV
jgi:glycosyltransferase involved in cell wall biosynthesis